MIAYWTRQGLVSWLSLVASYLSQLDHRRLHKEQWSSLVYFSNMHTRLEKMLGGWKEAKKRRLASLSLSLSLSQLN